MNVNIICSLLFILCISADVNHVTERCCQKYRCDIDSSPGGKYTCNEQYKMSKCNAHWMKGYCCKTCSSSCPEYKCAEANHTQYLSVDKATNNFVFNGNYIFLNGANQPFIHYGKDFGGDQYADIEQHLTSTLHQIQSAGGNTVRVWIFCEGKHYPIFDKNGKVIKSDPSDALIEDIESYLEIAEDNNIFVILTLWNAVVDFKDNGLYEILTDETGHKLQSFIDIVLNPLIETTKDYISLAAWEIINEPEGSLLPEKGATDCTNTIYLKDEGTSWTNTKLSVDKYQRFINIQAAAIKAIDPEALITVGAWSEKSNTNEFRYKNLWSDACLIEAGGQKSGILDFYQIHTYKNTGSYDKYAPLGSKLNSVRFYGLEKPLIIGEFESEHDGTQMIKEHYAQRKYMEIYRKGFNGALMWAMNDANEAKVCMEGMKVLANMSDVNVDISDVYYVNIWSKIWSILCVLLMGLLLFGKTCMVVTGCMIVRACCKCCKKGEDTDDGDTQEGATLMVRSREWYDRYIVDGIIPHWIEYCIKVLWICMGILCALIIIAGFVCAIVVWRYKVVWNTT